MLRAQSLSEFEKCPRLPILSGALTPPEISIREAVKREFARGIAEMVSGASLDSEAAEQRLLGQVSDGGITLPAGDVYTLARDHACWLGGAIELAAEVAPALLKPCRDVHGVSLNAYSASGCVYVFRVGANASEGDWNVLLAQTIAPVSVYTLVLPSVRNYRLPSPLNLGYSHPLTGQIRLSRRDGEKAFGPKWKRLGRWERGDIAWEEWRTGLDADSCLENVVLKQEFPLIEGEESEELLADMKALRIDVEMYAELPWEKRLNLWPKRREACSGCSYRSWCHGPTRERKNYAPLDHSSMQCANMQN